MTKPSLGPRAERLLEAWSETITEAPTGEGYDLVRPTRSERCQDRLEKFVSNPSETTFRELWSPDALAAAGEWNADIVLNLWDEDFQTMAEELAPIATADTYQPKWSDILPVSAAVMEMYGRTHLQTALIPSDQAKKALNKFNMSCGNSYGPRSESIRAFIDLYRDRVGHVRADDGIPLAEEVDQLFRLVTTVERSDLEAGIQGPQKELYQALLGYEGPNSGAQSGPITVFRDSAWPAIDGHIDARERGAYDDHEETEHWGGTHIETWKWDFAEYVESEIKSAFELDNLAPSEVDEFFDLWNASTDAYGGRISDQTPKKMMSRYGKDKYTYACEFCRDNPEEAAERLSILFDQDRHVETRLEKFGDFIPEHAF